LTKHAGPLRGTVSWMAPEVIRDHSKPTAKADVFSFGRMCFMLVAGARPLVEMSCNEIVACAQESTVPSLDWPAPGPRAPLLAECRPLAERCLRLSACMRPTMAEVLAEAEGWRPFGGDTISLHPLRSAIPGTGVSWADGLRAVREQLAPPATGALDKLKQLVPFPSSSSSSQTLGSSGGGGRLGLVDELMVATRALHKLVDACRIELAMDSVVNVGGYGAVLAGHLDGFPVVFRVPRDSISALPASRAFLLLDELRSLLHIKHPSIVALHGLCFDPTSGTVAPVLECVEGEKLDTFCALSAVGVPERQLLLSDISSAIWYLHSQLPLVVHGNLKSTGILVESRIAGPRAKLLDCGWSRALAGIPGPQGADQRSKRRAALWAAPEVLKNRALAPTPCADIFSFGRLCYLVSVGRLPLDNYDHHRVEAATKKGELLELEWQDDGSSSLGPRCQSLAERCMEINGVLRPDAAATHAEVRSWRAHSTTDWRSVVAACQQAPQKRPEPKPLNLEPMHEPPPNHPLSPIVEVPSGTDSRCLAGLRYPGSPKIVPQGDLADGIGRRAPATRLYQDKATRTPDAGLFRCEAENDDQASISQMPILPKAPQSLSQPPPKAKRMALDVLPQAPSQAPESLVLQWS